MLDRLSDAIAVGRVTIDTLQMGKLTGCVLGMAMNAHGISNEEDWKSYKQLQDKYPWLGNRLAYPCKNCYGYEGKEGPGMHVLWHLFDFHVMMSDSEQWSIDRIIDFVRSIEPPDPTETETHEKATAEVLEWAT